MVKSFIALSFLTLAPLALSEGMDPALCSADECLEVTASPLPVVADRPPLWLEGAPAGPSGPDPSFGMNPTEGMTLAMAPTKADKNAKNKQTKNQVAKIKDASDPLDRIERLVEKIGKFLNFNLTSNEASKKLLPDGTTEISCQQFQMTLGEAPALKDSCAAMFIQKMQGNPNAGIPNMYKITIHPENITSVENLEIIYESKEDLETILKDIFQ